MTHVSSQVAAAHLELIEAMSHALAPHPSDPAARAVALATIERYREDGWQHLADALTTRLAAETAEDGTPDEAQLDEEDRMILAAIQRAAREPQWLEGVVEQAEIEAAEQIAALILAATWGEHEALEALDQMREAAEAAGMPDSTAHAFVAIVEGERDLNTIVANHANAQAGLIERCLAALERREHGSA